MEFPQAAERRNNTVKAVFYFLLSGNEAKGSKKITISLWGAAEKPGVNRANF